MNALRRLLTATCVDGCGHAVVHADKLDAAIVAWDRDLALLDRYETDLARRDGITPAQLRARYTNQEHQP